MNQETLIANTIITNVRKKYPNVFIHKNVVGKAKLGSGFYSNIGLGKGSADLLCVVKGFTVWMECKVPGGKQSEDQIEFEAEARRSGAAYHVVTCLQDAYKAIDEVLTRA